MQYKIIEKREIPCRIIDWKLCRRKNNSKFVVVYWGEYDSGNFLRSVPDLGGYVDDSKINEIKSLIQNRTKFYIYRSIIRPSVDMYHKITWNDVDAGKHSREHLGEIERDKYGHPIQYNKIVVYTDLLTEDIRNEISPEYLPEDNEIKDVLDENYIKINDPYVHKALQFNNRLSYLERKERERREKEEKDEKIFSNFYDSYEERHYDKIGMSEEDEIMDALENGDAEVYGF